LLLLLEEEEEEEEVVVVEVQEEVDNVNAYDKDISAAAVVVSGEKEALMM